MNTETPQRESKYDILSTAEKHVNIYNDDIDTIKGQNEELRDRVESLNMENETYIQELNRLSTKIMGLEYSKNIV
jgi:prefoldin subunit 5